MDCGGLSLSRFIELPPLHRSTGDGLWPVPGNLLELCCVFQKQPAAHFCRRDAPRLPLTDVGALILCDKGHSTWCTMSLRKTPIRSLPRRVSGRGISSTTMSMSFSLALRGPITNICKSRRRISLRTEESVKKVRGFCRRHRQPNIPALVRPFDMLKICKNLYLPLKLSRDLVICIHPADNTGQVVHQNMGAA